MPFSLQDLTLPVAKLSPINLEAGPSSLERQRLQLMREQFENEKKHQSEQMQLAQMEEQGRTAREKMQQDRLAAAKQAEMDAAAKKEKLTTLQEFGKLNAAGDIEGARAMVPLMTNMGMSVELEGEVNGLPRYRIHMTPQEAAAEQAQGIGYPADDSAQMPPENIIGSTTKAFKKAQRATAQFEETGEPARGPDEPDYTGAVPKNVIDMSAIQAQTAARLNPALSGIVASYPEAYRESASKTAGAVGALGLPASKSVEMFDKLRGSPDTLIKGEQQMEAAQIEAGAKRSDAKGKDQQERFKNGFSYGKSIAKEYDIHGIIDRRRQLSQAAEVLQNKDPLDDYLAGAAVSRMMGERGATTEPDVQRALGNSAASFIDRIKQGLYKEAVGGLSPPQRTALLGVVNSARQADERRTSDFLSNIDDQLGSPDTDKEVARGLKAYRNMAVPRDQRESYEAARRPKAAPAAPPKPFNMEEDSRAPATTPSPLTDSGGVAIPQTSRIAFEHNNPGNLKFADQSGATQGEAAGDGGHWAKFESVDAGLDALRSQVLHDAEAGLSVRDFVTKYAPPGSNDTKTYIEQAARELKVDPDDPLADTDPYDVVRFVAKKESGTVLPSQYGTKGGSDDARLLEGIE